MAEIDIHKVIAQDAKEVKKLAHLVTVWVYNVVMGYVNNQQDAEEIIQDTLIKALEHIESFKQESTIKTWVYRIAINKSKDKLKYKRRKKRSGNIISLDADAGTMVLKVGNYYHPGDQLESQEQVDALFSGINQLPEKQKQAITLMKLEQMTQKEVAAVMKCTVKAVEGLITRGKANLLAYLQAEGIKYNKNR